MAKQKCKNPYRYEELEAEADFQFTKIKLCYQSIIWFQEHNVKSTDPDYKAMQQKLCSAKRRRKYLLTQAEKLLKEECHGPK